MQPQLSPRTTRPSNNPSARMLAIPDSGGSDYIQSASSNHPSPQIMVINHTQTTNNNKRMSPLTLGKPPPRKRSRTTATIQNNYIPPFNRGNPGNQTHRLPTQNQIPNPASAINNLQTPRQQSAHQNK